MGDGRDLRGRISSLFDLPEDIMLDVARVVLVGNAHLVVGNHRGLREYTPDRVAIEVPRGCLLVGGSDLTIASITPEEIVLLGKISAVQLTE